MGSPNPLRDSPISLDTSLEPGILVFRSMTGHERLGQPFVYRLEVTSRSYTGTGADLIGQPVAVHFEHAGGPRHFSALVADFEQGPAAGSYSSYYLTLRPWFWLLTQVHNSRIFQDKTIPDIVKDVLREHGFTDFEEHLFETYLKREMVVQYCESDFNFVSRLLEEEGIYYFFRHEQAKHILVFADSQSSHEPEADTKELPFYPPDRHRETLLQYVDTWVPAQRLRPDTFATSAYDFKHPKADLNGKRVKSADSAVTGLEVFEYPSPHLVKDQGDEYARRRLEELQGNLRTIGGGSNAPNLLIGRTFKLTDHPTEAENAEYLITATDFALREPELESNAANDDPTYRAEFEALSHSTPFRPRRVTPKPYMRGPQTARVVTSGTEDLTTDEFGRIHIKFHWDRFAKDDDTASAWVRVAQMWAGAGWGGQFIPRVNMEVVVIFLEGDPDHPLVTGCVYNGDNAPPYPVNTQSGVKSRSTKGGTPENFNEIRFEDKKGAEELHVQAEKDYSTLVKNDQSTTIGHDRTTTIQRNDTLNITGDQFIKIHGNLSMTVEGVTDSKNPDKALPVKSSMGITGAHTMDASDTIAIQAPNKITFTCGGSSITMTPGSITLTTAGSTIVIDPNIFAQSSGNSNLMLDANVFAKASGAASVLLDGNACVQSSGGSQLLLDAAANLTSNGDVGLSGATVKGKGKTEAGLDGGGSTVTLTPASADLAGAQVNVNGKGVVSIGGPMVKIG